MRDMSESLHICCPHCLATNRVPDERLTAGPKCGKCKKPLFTGQPVSLNGTSARPMLQNNNIPVLVDCWAEWCGPCKSFAPVFEQAARELEPWIRLAKLNTEEAPQLAGEWNIRSIPTLILFRGGKEVQRVSGALPLEQLFAWLQQAGVRIPGHA